MSDRRLRMSVALGCLAIGCLSLARVAAGQELRPNLRALPPFNLSIVANVDTGTRNCAWLPRAGTAGQVLWS